MGKVLIAITCMTLMSAHAAKLDNVLSGYSATSESRAGRQGFQTVSGVSSNVGSTFNTRNPTFNNFNQASIVGSLGNLNLGARGANQGYGYNAPQLLQVAGLNFGTPLGVDPSSQQSRFNAAIPGLTFTGFAPTFNQIPTTFFAANAGQQGLTTSRLSSLPSFTTASGARFGAGQNIGQGSTTISLSPISFGNANSQSSTGSGFGSEIGVIPTRGSSSTSSRTGTQSGSNQEENSSSIVSSPVTLDSALSQPSTVSGTEFSVSPAARGSFKGPGVVTGITAGDLQSTTRFSNDPITLVAGGPQRPSQSSSTGSRSNTGSTAGFNAGITSGLTTGSRSRFNAGSTQSFNAGSTQGFNAGSTQGFNAGSTQGFNAGSTQGFNAGSTQGFNAGSTQGFNAGSTSGFNAGITSFTTGSRPGFNTGSNSGFNTGGLNFNAPLGVDPASGFNAASNSGSTSFDFGQSSGVTGGGISRGYLPPNA